MDELTKIAYSSNNSMAAIGMSNEAISAVNDASLILGHSLMGAGMDATTAGELQKAYQDFITADINSLGGYAALGVKDVYGLQNAMRTTTNNAAQVDLAKTFFSQILSSNALSGNDTYMNQSIQERFPALNIDQLAGLRGLDFNKFSQNTALDLSNIDQTLAESSAEQFVQETTEITWLESIYNKLDAFFNSIDSANLINLANAAFTLLIASKGFEIYDKVFNSGLIGNLLTSSKATASALSSGGSGIIASGGGIALGAAAIAALSASIVKSTLGITGSRENLTNFANANDNKTWLGKGLDLAKAGFSNSAGLVGQSLATAVRDSNIGRLLTATGLVSKDKLTDTALLAKATWLRVSSNLASGLYGAEDADLYRLAALIAFDKADWLKYTDNKENHAYLVNWYNRLSDEKKQKVQNYASRDGDISSLAKDIDWSNYHKAGLDKVPKDNYKALLHKGEMVLNAEEAEAYRKGLGIGGYDAVPWTISSYFGSKSSIRGGVHSGTDFSLPEGTPIGAAIGGEVIPTTYNNAWGNYVIIKGDNGLYYRYAHFSKKLVNGGRVNTGQNIGLVGSTGNSTGSHLHFEVDPHSYWVREEAMDPAPYVTSGLLGDPSAVTPEVRSSSLGNTSSVSSDGSMNSMASSNAIPVRTKRFIPSSMNSSNYGHGGADKIVNSVNGNFGKLISYLDDIRKEQDVQKEMINTFSRTNTEGVIS